MNLSYWSILNTKSKVKFDEDPKFLLATIFIRRLIVHWKPTEASSDFCESILSKTFEKILSQTDLILKQKKQQNSTFAFQMFEGKRKEQIRGQTSK